MKKQAMVVCPQPEAAESGTDILRAGGNAVDAAVATALAQTVVDPLMCGIAGFGTAAVYLPGAGVHEYFDFHSPAPLAAREDMWEDLLEGETPDGFGFILKGRVNDIGPQSIATPATLKGLEAMHQAYGRLPWRQVVEPAIRWAQDGFFVRPGMHAFWIDEPTSGRVGNLERLQYGEEGRALYCRPDGRPKPIGAPLRNEGMARVLRRIADEGSHPFYQGDLAREMVAHLQSLGALITLEDLARYEVQRNAPLVGSYRDRTVTTNQPPGGGAMLLEMLNILENFDLGAMEHNSPEYLRIVCEAMKKATSDKDRHIGDPRFFDVPLDQLLSKDMAREAAAQIRAGRRFGVERVNPGAPVPRDTTHLCVVDGDGNCVSMTHSLAMPSGVITPGMGFLYNGCMGVFDPRPGRAGSIRPGKSRFTSSCPTITFKDGKLDVVLGAPGGTQIAMGVLQVLLNVIDHGMQMQAAVSAPRFSSTSNAIDVCNRIPRHTARALEAQGYQVNRNPYNYTIAWVHGVQALPDGLHGGADPGRDGVAYGLML
ncbi:gamma-glutamyltranspeptidase [Alicycliphilus denitrificans]|uniref:gamma-glutamyltransferase n=1 Tax=Alicycliphilus denitrificans TaxID=179636 RepID=UPI0009628862|nr:gamma-glutamyltransferase [Alicycliphilus denitrificans]MBN9574751.1 gamma-glutamyltransferase [Alicycliphilus denitrificans]OJW86660.1 MAG: gamma-glutamyltransferase [Alicycliphilus sp. 69-12]BCN41222.1 gamma-glutamyltranspeptidase [Alicycliphilus denitrificans]